MPQICDRLLQARRLSSFYFQRSGSWMCLLVWTLCVALGQGMSEGQMKELRHEAEHMFYHGYESYLNYAFPEDEIRPIACKPLTRDRQNPTHIEINDVLGNYSLTMIDSLSTLAVLASSSFSSGGKSNKALKYFQTGVAALVEQYGDGSDGAYGHGLRGRGFDLDSKVQVFETVIRGVGGLVSAHLFAVGDLPIKGYQPQKAHGGSDKNPPRPEQIQWPNNFKYDGQLLRLAQDLGNRLLPAFHTSTGLPYPRVNLRHGIPFYASSPLNYDSEHGQCQTTQKPIAELTETCSAGAGSLVLEFTTLSRLSGDPRFEQLAKRAFWAIWDRRSSIGLIGSGIDAETGHWTSPFTGIGAGIDSFFEYAAKSYVLLSNSPSHFRSVLPPKNTSQISENDPSAESFLKVWQDSQASIRRHIYRGNMFIHPHYIQADLHTGAARAFWMDSLSAFYPGLLTLTGDLEEAIETHILLTALWTRYSALPERWSTSSGGVESGLGWWGGRPEFIESTYHLYQATRDPWYLHVGEMALRDIKRRCWAKCGWTGIQDVRSGEKSDRMESFFLGETMKYLFLLFDPDHPLNKLDAPFVFSTEGHPLIIPSHTRAKIRQGSSRRSNTTIIQHAHDSVDAVCPLPPVMVPFSISATASRKDLFHAANLARLHFMPTPDTLESPLVEYSRDHPSISISDVRSPSNYTYFPWTLPLDLVPHNGVCSKITARSTFDITFPSTPNTPLGPGALQRVLNGILVNSIGGLRLGMIQDVPTAAGSGLDGNMYRVHAINNILLGKDERVFLAKDTASSVINPLDPNFTRVRDSSMLDLVVDVILEDGEAEPQKANDPIHNESSPSSFPELILAQALEDGSAAASSMMVALGSLLQQVTSLIREEPPVETPKPIRMYIPAVTSTGIGAAPLPDVDDALGPDVSGLPQGTLLWDSIYVADENCSGKLSSTIPRDHQVIVMIRGGCSFTQKLQNIPIFVPTKSALQLVVIVSHDEDDEAGLPPGYLTRPWLEIAQMTPSGLPRHHPIPIVMVGGGKETWEMFKTATSLGVKRKYSVQAQGVPISNVVIL